MLELHALFKGRVQGVGFRWTIVEYAERHGITGTVQNLANGAVEVFAQGSEAALKAFLTEAQANPGFARIESVQTTFRKPAQKFEDFKILSSSRHHLG